MKRSRLFIRIKSKILVKRNEHCGRTKVTCTGHGKYCYGCPVMREEQGIYNEEPKASPMERIMVALNFPIYTCAYLLSHALKLKGRENMESLSEWIEFIVHGKSF